MNISFFGIGLMGSRMARRVLDAGHDLTVYNRTIRKTRALREAGAAVAESPAAAVEHGEVLIMMVTDAGAVRDLLLAPDTVTRLSGRTVLQMSTIAPNESVEIAELVRHAGGQYLEAPVLGSIPQAESGKLILMAGGGPDLFERLLPLLQVFGPDPMLVGPVGKGAALKLCMNQLIASMMAAFSFSYGMAQNEGVPNEHFMGVLRRSALYAPMFESKFPNLSSRDFSNPNFPARHMLKDVNLVLSASAGSGLDTRMVEAVRAMIESAIDKGHAGSDYSSIFEGVAGNPVA